MVHTKTFLITATAMGIPGLAFLLRKYWNSRSRKGEQYDPDITDPGILKKRSTIEAYSTSIATYPAIRTFYSPHQHADKLPGNLPLLVFIHGLGGSVAQFYRIVDSLVNSAPCLAIDFPGCGRSEFTPRVNAAYTKEALAELVAVAVERYRGKPDDSGHGDVGQRVILIGHSMGSTIAALLASSGSPVSHLLANRGIVAGCIAICPSILPPSSEKQIKGVKFLKRLPSFLFDLFRAWDKRGGIDSPSVARFVGRDTDKETKKLQLRWNEQSKTKVFQMTLNALVPPDYDASGSTGREAETCWSAIRVPLFLVAGASDHLCPPSNAQSIMLWLTGASAPGPEVSRSQIRAANPIRTNPTQTHNAVSNHGTNVRLTYFPAPAGHAFLFTTSTYHVLSRLIEKFNAELIDHQLDPSWQMQHLTTSGKWDVKNLAKWEKVSPCSKPIGRSSSQGISKPATPPRILFRAMKTMREVDSTHNPIKFASNYAFDPVERPDGVVAIVDISHDPPVYKPESLAGNGIEYHKFPTVSKLPPNNDEVTSFIAKIESLATSETLASKIKAGGTIAVHCHYGFNRTGFLIVAYLVEKMGWDLQEAVDEFAREREPGIKHSYFVDELWVRYGGRC